MGYLSRLVATLQSSSFVGTSWIVVLIPIPQMLPVCFYKFRNPTSFWKSEKGRNRLQPIHCQSIPFFRTTKVAQKKSIKSIMTSREGFFVGFFDRSNLNLGDFTNLENSSKLIAPSPAKIRKKKKKKKLPKLPTSRVGFSWPFEKVAGKNCPLTSWRCFKEFSRAFELSENLVSSGKFRRFELKLKPYLWPTYDYI